MELQPQEGIFTFSDGFVLHSGLKQSIQENACSVFSLGQHPTDSGTVQVLAHGVPDGLDAAWLICDGVLSAAAQRKLLCDALGLRDTPADTAEPFQVCFPFGSVHISTDPYAGRCEALILWGERD